jgi:hypothetical protein
MGSFGGEKPIVPDLECHVGYLLGFGLLDGGEKTARKMGQELLSFRFDEDAFGEVEKIARTGNGFFTSPFIRGMDSLHRFRQYVGLAPKEQSLKDSSLMTSENFKALLLWTILLECRDGGSISIGDCNDFAHAVLETIPGAGWGYAYDKDPEGLTAWYEAAEKDPPHRSYSRSDLSTPYWRIECSHTVSPYHLIEKLIGADPSGVLRAPRNMREIASASVEFAEAYFPTCINKQRRKQLK